VYSQGFKFNSWHIKGRKVAIECIKPNMSENQDSANEEIFINCETPSFWRTSPIPIDQSPFRQQSEMKSNSANTPTIENSFASNGAEYPTVHTVDEPEYSPELYDAQPQPTQFLPCKWVDPSTIELPSVESQTSQLKQQNLELQSQNHAKELELWYWKMLYNTSSQELLTTKGERTNALTDIQGLVCDMVQRLKGIEAGLRRPGRHRNHSQRKNCRYCRKKGAGHGTSHR
jgi:hypothetical protein